MPTLTRPRPAPVLRKLPLYRWLVAGVSVLGLLVGAAQIKSHHKTVLEPVTAIVQVAPQPLKAAPSPVPAPVVQAAPKKQPAKPATRKAAPKKV